MVFQHLNGTINLLKGGIIVKMINRKFITNLIAIAAITVVVGFQNCSNPSSTAASSATTDADTTTTTAVTTSVYSSPSDISSITSPSVTEGSSVSITITMSTVSTSARVYKYMTVDASAYSGYNYTEISGEITIPAYSKTVSISVSTLDDGQNYGDTYFYLYVGQLDLTDPVYVTSTIAIVESSSTSYQSMVTGTYHTCGIDSSSAVWCWGYNNHGQVGDGGTTNSNVPESVSALSSSVTALAAGTYHTCAIMNAKLYCWGYNGTGQLGVGNKSDYYAPKSVTSMTSGITAVAAGNGFTCAIKSGALYCWGDNTYGQLGNGTTTATMAAATVSGLTDSVTHVSTGFSHACAIKSEALYCWGRNTSGEVGDGTTTNQSYAQAVSGMESGVTSVSTGYNYTCAVQSGRVKCWGLNTYGQLGTSNTTAHVAPYYIGLSSATKVFANLLTTCAQISDGSLKCWGYNGYGQVGTGSTTGGITAPNAVFSSGVTGVSQGHGYHTCAQVNSSQYCWGYNYYGQLGTGSYTTSNLPQAITY